MRTLVIGALAAMLVGCSSQLPPHEASASSCTGPACPIAVPVQIEPVSVKHNSATYESKSAAACDVDQPAPRKPRHAARPIRATPTRIIAAAACARNTVRLDPALLVPVPAPDCEYKRSDFNPVDRDEWARLKVEYERQCFQNAEKAARDRLTLLQASSTCETGPGQQPRMVRPKSGQPKQG